MIPWGKRCTRNSLRLALEQAQQSCSAPLCRAARAAVAPHLPDRQVSSCGRHVAGFRAMSWLRASCNSSSATSWEMHPGRCRNPTSTSDSDVMLVLTKHAPASPTSLPAGTTAARVCACVHAPLPLPPVDDPGCRSSCCCGRRMGMRTGREASVLPLLGVRMVMHERLGRVSSSGSGFSSSWHRSSTMLVSPAAASRGEEQSQTLVRHLAGLWRLLKLLRPLAGSSRWEQHSCAGALYGMFFGGGTQQHHHYLGPTVPQTTTRVRVKANAPTQSAICAGMLSSHIAPSRKLCSVLGRSFRAMGKAGAMSSDTHRLRRCGRKQRASMPPSRQAWLAEDSSKDSRLRRRAVGRAGRRQAGRQTGRRAGRQE